MLDVKLSKVGLLEEEETTAALASSWANLFLFDCFAFVFVVLRLRLKLNKLAFNVEPGLAAAAAATTVVETSVFLLLPSFVVLLFVLIPLPVLFVVTIVELDLSKLLAVALFVIVVDSFSCFSNSGSSVQKPPLPGSSFWRAIFLKHLFSDKLCRIEFLKVICHDGSAFLK